MELHNKLSREELKRILAESKVERLTLSFYKYAKIENPATFRDDLYLRWNKLGILGRTYVANEGINAQISVPREHFETFRTDLYSIPFLNNCRLNVAIEEEGDSFIKLKIKVRKKIVADGLDDATFDVTKGGQHVNAQEFNELTNRPETVIVDMRNHYESEIGHFKGAITPDVDTFRDSLPIVKDMLEDKKNQPIVMYCTGGIRCEKASAYLKHHGFEQVYQLDGGIIEYTRQAQNEDLEIKFKGKNFVFDHRLGERISTEVISKCHQCGQPCDVHTNCSNVGCNLLFIQCGVCKEKLSNCCSIDCKDIIALSEEEQKLLRQGKKQHKRYYRKGKSNNLRFKL